MVSEWYHYPESVIHIRKKGFIGKINFIFKTLEWIIDIYYTYNLNLSWNFGLNVLGLTLVALMNLAGIGPYKVSKEFPEGSSVFELGAECTC